MGREFQRLPNLVVPRNYTLTLKPDLEKFTFTGHENIDVTVNTSTNVIVLNSKELEYQKVIFKSKDGKELVASDIAVNDKQETVTLTFGSSLEQGEGNLIIDFTGTLNDKMKGFYRSKVVDADGKESWAATTQFEATDARRAFPCWDEPALKASFDVTLIAPKDLVALSNMLPETETPDPSDPAYKIVKFQRTPIMSTYLVAFIIGDFAYVEGKSGDGVRVRVYAPKGSEKYGEYALRITERSLPFYGDYFNIPYPLTKMDLIAIPDFAMGAMENWGLVTYRSIQLLYNPSNTSTLLKQYIALTVTHELAHQWFGNLVTMDWWTDLWLNEGFATFVEHLCTDALFPEMKIWMPFVTDVLVNALTLDALENTHPIEVPVNDPGEIDEIFDAVSYSKGASVIRMLYHYLGEENFRKGMGHYLTRHAYKNTVTQDLWNALEEISGKPVSKVMPSWTKQKGYPLISVEELHNGTRRALKLTQQLFCPAKLLGLKKSESDDDNQVWLIPIAASTQRDPSQPAAETLMDSKSTTITIENVQENDWVKLNPGAIGFYRVNYPPSMLSKFESAIKDKTLPALDRFHLHNDLNAMVAAGRISAAELLKFMQHYVDEDDYTVWSSISDCIRKIHSLLSNTDDPELLNTYGQKLFRKIYEKVGWEVQSSDSHLDLMRRTVVISRLVSLKDPQVLQEAKARFQNYLEKGEQIVPDLRSTVYRAVGCDCDMAQFERFFELYRNATEDEEKLRLAQGLCATSDPERINRVLEFGISNDVRFQDAGRFFTLLSMTGLKNREMAWEFFVKNREMLLKRYESGSLINNIIKGITNGFASSQKADEIEKYFAESSIPGADRTVQQCIEEIRLNAAWLERDLGSIKAYIATL